MSRPSWEEIFMEIAVVMSKRSTCLRRQVGADLVLDKKILGTGYNGAPSGFEHCLNIGCEREKLGIPSGERLEVCRGIHAENNAIRQALHARDSLIGAELFCTNFPCSECAKLIADEGIKRVVYLESYSSELAEKILREGHVKFEKFKGKLGTKEY
ncbi:MAG: cytidine deaminase [Parcubacteria group bacterium]|nr:cytidine deaminase [Parcubacteria group bacterium]|tara:strand:+ start:939 stop:1406 length:468 start_codon:yes stop_codon:yes gene_type:complete